MQFLLYGDVDQGDLPSATVRLSLELDAPNPNPFTTLVGQFEASYQDFELKRRVDTFGGYAKDFLDSVQRLRKGASEPATLRDSEPAEVLRVTRRADHHPYYLLSLWWTTLFGEGTELREGEYRPGLPLATPRAGFHCLLLGVRFEEEQAIGLVEFLQELLQSTGVSLDVPY